MTDDDIKVIKASCDRVVDLAEPLPRATRYAIALELATVMALVVRAPKAEMDYRTPCQ